MLKFITSDIRRLRQDFPIDLRLVAAWIFLMLIYGTPILIAYGQHLALPAHFVAE